MNLNVKNLSYSIEEKKIIDNVSLHVADGEFVGLIGPNGSGKSTLLKNVYRVFTPDEGEVLLADKPVAKMTIKESARFMAVMGQFHSVNFDFSVLDMVLMGRTPYKTGMGGFSVQDYEQVNASLRLVGMEHQAERLFTSLSGGEQQRVLLARAMVQTPKLLVLDEPTNHLDITYQLKLLSLVKELKISVIAALHDLNLAAQYCDRLYALNAGKIVYEGTPEQVLTKDNIRRLYGVDCEITFNLNGRPKIYFEAPSETASLITRGLHE